MGKQGQRRSASVTKRRKLMIRYQSKWDTKTLTRAELQRFSSGDQTTYLEPLVRQLHPQSRTNTQSGETPTIGGWYACLNCAKAAVFRDGYVSEDGDD